MKTLVGACIMILTLLGCYLPVKQDQNVKTFFENLESYNKGSEEIVTEGIFSNLKLYVSEHQVLVDIKKTLISLKDSDPDPNHRDVSPVPDYNEAYFNKFFLDLGSGRSKELISLFGRVKNENNDKFKHEISWLYWCISELYSPDIKYSGEEGYEYTVFMPRPTIYQQYLKVKEKIIKHTLR
ncbi:P52 family lipoprotein (plasmid) [Borreliella spielmanii]|uniref:Outer membrane protein n=1 Tax=Borreliella spielmanii A14S TaxID=498742 RepID=C0RC10_9SPIR|nr:P52 family lipoprotein [Borreliella spielmanii]ACN53327.1 outer membrane protein [Borreliella spielmanii A14S]WKC83042.1 P52 family lipoprotein [Borreliella spielmanii]